MRSHGRTSTKARVRRALSFFLWSCMIVAAFPLVSEAQYKGRAVRLAPGFEVDQLLATVMDSDSSPIVRSDAIFAARFRHPLPSALADAVLHTASSDSVDYVRSDALALIRQNPSASPNIPDTLEHIANCDTNTGIRRQASEALASLYSGSLSKP